MESGYYPTGHDPTGKAFAGSLITHGVVIALLATSGLFNLSKNNFGNQHSSSGSVGVDIVKTIPIPRREAPVNPLANDSTSIVPQKPMPKPEIAPKEVKAQPEKAIEIPDKTAKKKKLTPKQLQSYFRPPDPYKNNQVFSNTPQAASSPLYGMQGASGIDIGPASVLGNQYGAYVNLIVDRISQHWNRANVHTPPSQKAGITFTIARDGSVSSVKLADPSGDYLLDTSATRAVMDANPLPALPQGFLANHKDATVELWFQIKQ